MNNEENENVEPIEHEIDPPPTAEEIELGRRAVEYFKSHQPIKERSNG